MTDRVSPYASPAAGLPPQTALHTQRAVFTEAYAVIPCGVMRDIVTSLLPGWTKTRAWILARPLSGFSETFAQLIVEISEGGGATQPEPDEEAEGWLFVTGGEGVLTLNRETHRLTPGTFAYLPPGTGWTIASDAEAALTVHWVRKRYEPAPGLPLPRPIIARERDVAPTPMPDTNGAWATTRFIDPGDLSHDAHVNIVTFQPGASIPFEETHVMEHGIYVLQGKAVYRLNRDWVEVEAGDFVWLRAFCPQACYAGGPEPFRYLLYKDVNRHPKLTPG